MTQANVLAQLGSTSVPTFRNRIINGAMVIDQRNAGASVTPNNTYTLDRWNGAASVASKYTVQQNAGSVTPPVGFTKYLGCVSSSAYAVGASDYFAITQTIEGYNMADLGWGTANAKTITVSAWVYSSLTGTFGGSFRGSGRYYPFSYSIPVANTWTQISITIAGDTAGTWTSDNTAFGAVWFSLGAGSSFSGTAGAWGTGNYTSVTGATSVVGTSGATFYITGVQLEVGSSATSFEYRYYGHELALCQRYYQVYNVGNSGFPTFITYVSNGDTRGGLQFVSTMRTTPTISFNTTTWSCIGVGDIGGVVNINPVISLATATPSGFYISVNNPSVFSAASSSVAVWGTNASPTYYASAEL